MFNFFSRRRPKAEVNEQKTEIQIKPCIIMYEDGEYFVVGKFTLDKMIKGGLIGVLPERIILDVMKSFSDEDKKRLVEIHNENKRIHEELDETPFVRPIEAYRSKNA